MFGFGNANDGQRKAIAAADGPVLITAGPGTGKTYTLVQRAIYLIEECNVRPESIFIATFTEKAAKELVTRITNELANRNITANINEMYIGTFHSLCLRILKEHLEYTRLRRNYRLMDSFDQQYMVFQNIHRFRSIPEIEIVLPNGGAWKQAETICNFVNNLSEELVSPEELMSDRDPSIASLGRMLQEYRTILTEANLMDFSSIQIEAYRLLCDNEDILNELRSAITHIMVDEYQDTNYIQEQLVFLLAGERKNICVVGDDDQGLYRFRGATIRNILEFPQKFADGECRIIPLVINYRSNSDIVDFYNRWMGTTDGAKFKFRWENFRYEKRIEPHEKTSLHSPAVVKLAGVDDEDEWHEKILQFINDLKASGKLTDYNQIAFLFNSVKHPRVTALARFLEENHINVYSPRSDMFFQRDEIRLALGCLMLMFPFYVQGLENGEYTFLQPEHLTYYRNCIMLANEYLTQPEHTDLLKWIRRRGKDHVSLTGATDYAYCGLMYQMFEFQPFSGILDTDMDVGVVDIRPARNLAKLTQIIGKFEYLHRVDVLSADKYRGKRGIDANTELLFTLHEKEYSEPVDFKLVDADLSKYASIMYERDSLARDTTVKEKNIDHLKDNMRYSEFSLAGEVARYLNISCILAARILRESVDGIDAVLEAVNRYNAVLDDYIIPAVFHALFDVTSELKTEDKELVLLHEPKDAGYYEFSAKDDLVLTNHYPGFKPEEIAKSFHADTYCFDSKPEKECFMQYITSGKVAEVYFTGMFTSNQGDLSVHYYDPESGRIRQYYPDFLAKMTDGSYQLIEVKGDNKIDDAVVKAKQAAAEEMAIASGIKYLMYAGSQIVSSHVLDDESSPLQNTVFK